MFTRVPPNLGRHEFPATFHIRCTEKMREAIVAHGGARWVRAVIQANIAAPYTANPERGAYAGEKPAEATQADTGGSSRPKRKRPRKRTLDKRKGR